MVKPRQGYLKYNEDKVWSFKPGRSSTTKSKRNNNKDIIILSDIERRSDKYIATKQICKSWSSTKELLKHDNNTSVAL